MKKVTNICGGDLQSPINVNDDNAMIAAGIRNPKREVISFKKTPEEKAALKAIPPTLHKATPWKTVCKVQG